MDVKKIVKHSLPPFLIDVLKRLQSGVSSLPPEWEYLPSGWQDGDQSDRGWNVNSIAEAQRDKWANFVTLTEGAGPLGIAHEALIPNNQDIGAHATIISFGYVVAIAARCKDSISMLDWGGGIGHYGLLARALLPGVKVNYHCKDMELLCHEGRKNMSDFTYHEDEKTCFSCRYDIVMASGSMHYSKDWRLTMKSLANSASGYLYITRIPIVSMASTFAVLQRPYMYGYNTEYVCWFVNRNEFLNNAEGLGLVLVREFLVSESPNVKNAPDHCQYSGFLFKHIS